MAETMDEAAEALRAAERAMLGGDVDGVVAHLSAAVRRYTAAGQPRPAAVACSRLGFVYGTLMGNRVAARPWFGRAERLLEDEGPCVERGWVALAPMGCDVDDPAELLERAEVALDMARRFGDVDLEVKALADGGLAHVEAGRLAEGMVDEALLRELGADLAPTDEGRARAAGACRVASMTRDGTWWTARCGETSVRLRDTKGLQYLADLVAHPGVECHVIDLVDLVEGVGGDGQPDRRRLGDAGAMLDQRARAMYRRRVEELRDEVDHALLLEDDDRAAKAQAELDALVAELARAVGLGGRDRKASATVEKARLNVTRALRSATAKLVEALPGPGEALDRRVRTGTYCIYQPEPGDDLRWTVQPSLNGTGPR